MMKGKRRVKLSQLTPNDKNPRRIHGAAFDKLCESIERDPEFMVLRPIVVDENNVILGGNQRYEACVALGKDVIPGSWVKVVSGLTDEQKKRFILVDNAPDGMAGEWDDAILADQWTSEDLERVGFDLYSLGLLEYPEAADDPLEHWQGMPEFQQENLSWKSITVRFETKEDYEAFAELVGQKMTDKTLFIWYPAMALDSWRSRVYADEEDGADES